MSLASYQIMGASPADVIAKIARELSFPDYFGGNLDALYDCLTDLGWLPPGDHMLIWSGTSALAAADGESYARLAAVLTDAVAAGTGTNRRLSVIFWP
ncbi:barstar family protein [Nonomuraea sp. NPDC050663]|uniref:barstar family protein n=1 Tax=Nonomuraea sp. NPDC050663 TaxID=3364370 RepID=UPI003799679E